MPARAISGTPGTCIAFFDISFVVLCFCGVCSESLFFFHSLTPEENVTPEGAFDASEVHEVSDDGERRKYNLLRALICARDV